MTSLEHVAETAPAAPLKSDAQLLRDLERRSAADGDAYTIDRCVPCPDQRAAYLARAVRLLNAPRWEQRNLGVKLIGLLQATDRHGAIVAMIEDRTPAGWLARCFGGDFRNVGFIRRNALAALARLGVVDAAVEGALLAALGDPYYEARAEAARTISLLAPRIRERRADLVVALARCTRDRTLEVASAAAEALGAIGDRHHALPALLSLGEARYWKVRAAALRGLLALVERQEYDDLAALDASVRRFVLASTDFKPEFHIKRSYGDLLTAIETRRVSFR